MPCACGALWKPVNGAPALLESGITGLLPLLPPLLSDRSLSELRSSS